MADGSDIGESHVLSALMKVHAQAVAIETAMDNCVTYQAHGKMMGEFRGEMLGKFERLEDHLSEGFKTAISNAVLQITTAIPGAARIEAKAVLAEAQEARAAVMANESDIQRQITLANRNGLIGMVVGIGGPLMYAFLKAVGVHLP